MDCGIILVWGINLQFFFLILLFFLLPSAELDPCYKDIRIWIHKFKNRSKGTKKIPTEKWSTVWRWKSTFYNFTLIFIHRQRERKGNVVRLQRDICWFNSLFQTGVFECVCVCVCFCRRKRIKSCKSDRFFFPVFSWWKITAGANRCEKVCVVEVHCYTLMKRGQSIRCGGMPMCTVEGVWRDNQCAVCNKSHKEKKNNGDITQ